MDTIELIETIVDRAKIVRAHFVPGYEEKVYKNALYIELVEAGLSVETEVPFSVSYKGHVIGSYKADMIVENYLTATGIDDGILLNFGSERIQIRHRTRLYCPKAIITDI